MKHEYKRIDTATIKGITEAESLLANGWRIIAYGMDIMQFERPIKQKYEIRN